MCEPIIVHPLGILIGQPIERSSFRFWWPDAPLPWPAFNSERFKHIRETYMYSLTRGLL